MDHKRSFPVLCILLTTGMLALAACSPSGSAGGTSSSGDGSCTQGMLGCACLAGTACWPGSPWVCVNDQCQMPACEEGDEGCTCYSNGTCNNDGNGEPLVCTGGTCHARVCTPGEYGCACLAGGTCQEGLECASLGASLGCVPRNCTAGTDGCPCATGRACNGGLICAQDTCVVATCTPGAQGCWCRQDLSCGAGMQCNADGRCEETPCTPGSLGCTCNAGACTGTGNLCAEDNTCQPANCVAGQEGCTCATGDTCAVAEDGTRLFCEGATCRRESCSPGSLACACRDGWQCTAGGQCVNGTCTRIGCTAGEAQCVCAGHACQPNLRCREDDVCVDATGYISGRCTATGGCNRGGRCEQDYCVRCTLGTPGCACNDANACVTGASCVAGTCLADSDIPPVLPDNIRCYTPCSADMVGDAGFALCGTDGLMDGCVDGRSCREGSCLLPNEPVPSCTSQVECPDFQTCIGGRCYSECEDDTECPSGKACFNHVCRIRCNGTTQLCGAGLHCRSVDGTNGYCAPDAPKDPVAAREVIGSFTVNRSTVNFSNNAVSGTFQITNQSPLLQTFVVRKMNHLLQKADGTATRATRASDGAVEGCDGGSCVCSALQPCAGNDHQCVDGMCRPVQCTTGTCPLFWLRMGASGETPVVGEQISLDIEPGASRTVTLANAADVEGVGWQAVVQVINEDLGKQNINLMYSQLPEGQWAGHMTYLASFGTRDLAAWRVSQTTRDNDTLQQAVGNALVQRWGAFRRGVISWDEMQAVFTATASGSWKYANVKAACGTSTTRACYQYNTSQAGVNLYSSDTSSIPVPSGVVEMPFAMNLRFPAVTTTPRLMTGRIDSSKALQYAGAPAVTVNFASDPAACGRISRGACITFLDSLEATIRVGGRYLADASDTSCSRRSGQGYQLHTEPWLVPGFTRHTSTDSETGVVYRSECRDSQLPWQSTEPATQAAYNVMNLALAPSNPIPDAQARVRQLSLLDGALINQNQLVVLFEEKFSSFLGGNDTDGFSAYGFMILQKRSTDLDTTDANSNNVADVFEGATATDTRGAPASDPLAPSCSPDILSAVLGANGTLNSTNAATVTSAILDGVKSASAARLTSTDNEQVHYLCSDTGLFDGGPDNVTPHGPSNLMPNSDSCGSAFVRNGACEDGGPFSTSGVCAIGTDATDCGMRYNDDKDVRVACPPGSTVTFFTVDASQMSQAALAALPCQDDGTCQATLNQWLESANPIINQSPIYTCTSSSEVYCDSNRYNLRQGKSFYAASEAQAVFVPLQTLVDDAFRYETRFRSRSGGAIGFAPSVCVPGSDAVPYCYDPGQIEQIEDRTDCLLYIHRNLYSALDTAQNLAVRQKLDAYLKVSFSSTTATPRGATEPVTYDGFERDYARLLIMLGDDAYTRSFASRFDLAATNTAAFEGDKFEAGGIRLSGASGFDLYKLYQGIQYYQKVLDRFYSHSPLIWSATGYTGTNAYRNFVTPETVIAYLDRVVRASTQKARAWGEVAKRYQKFNRASLARSVVERAYTGTYLESMVVGRMMLRVVSVSLPEQRDQILAAADDAQKRYRAALLDMGDVHSAITDNVTVFGLPEDYIPFPALDGADFRQSNAFEATATRVQTLVQTAREREEQALASSRDFETNAAQFQSELTQIRQNYENQLADLCGTFAVPDGTVYPAITKYAYLDARATVLGEPCGLMGNGALHNALGAFEELELDARSLQVNYANVLEEVAIEETRVSEQCGAIYTAADYAYSQAGEIKTLSTAIKASQLLMMNLQFSQQMLAQMASLQKCSVGTSTDCPTAVASLATYVTGSLVSQAGITAVEVAQSGMELEIEQIQRETARWQTRNECTMAQIDSSSRTATMLLRLKELDLENIKLDYRARLALSEVQRLRNQAKRLEQEQAETEAMTINVQAAHNDPNVRIYRNDAIINAELTFSLAIKAMYKLTRIYEYYTSTSYAAKGDLFLIAMVSRGDKNLDNYFAQLQEAFAEFEEEFGNPAVRVHIVSLKNDILRIPYVDSNGKAYTDAQRTGLLREKLRDVSYLDRNGYLTFPFNTRLDHLSPLTRNHKLLQVEADVYGNDTGDHVGRVYLRMKGTGTIHSLEGVKQFHRFDPRTAVVNTIFGGLRYFDTSVYQSYRMRDRPFVNTHWELVINQRDERVNQDINLSSITDIRINMYYSDFTAF